jgi:hypothetical protein
MNQDELFRQALQRQNDRAAGMKMPHDMEQRVMERIKPKKPSYLWMYAVSIAAVAASILLLLMLHNNNKGLDVEPKEKTMTAQRTEQQDRRATVGEKSDIGQEHLSPTESERERLNVNEQTPMNISEKLVVAQKTQVKNTSTVKNQSTIHTKTAQTAATTDQLNDYIARLEAEMEAVDDSVRSAHLEKLIAADYRLQQLVNRIVKVEEERAMNELKKDSTANYINF